MQKLIGLFTLIIAIASAQKKQYVQIYYESLCPDSQAFITTQLYPALTKNGLSDYVQLEWIPFGKSTMENRGPETIFKCHHGENECYGNKIHACALAHIEGNSYEHRQTKEKQTLDYINCLMSMGKNFDDNIYPGQKCAQENQISQWSAIKNCAESTEGSNLLKNYGSKTGNLKPPLSTVPYITFGGRNVAEVSKRAVTDFGKTLCEQFEEPKPKVCVTYNSGTMTAVTALLVPLVTLVTLLLK